MSEPQMSTMPRIGDKAPDFTALTTHGEIKFHEWMDKSWTILFSHPADFTPVCTTEFIAFSQRWDEFQKRGVKLIGVSIDSIHAHIAWIHNIKEKMNTDIQFPVVADLDAAVAQKYGMLHQAASVTATVRAVFVIDPNAIVRAIIYYPLNAGRNMDEILRLIDALQTVDKHGVACPANWKPGDKVIVPPPKTIKEMEDRLSGKYDDVTDFYLVKKSL